MLKLVAVSAIVFVSGVVVGSAPVGLFTITELRMKCPKDFTILSGDDSLTLPMMSLGVHGVVSVASHLFGKQIKMMIRSMAPKIIATDEIGGRDDLEAIKEASFMGTKLLLTMHGKDIEDISKDFLEGNMFKNIIILTKKQKPGEIKKIYKLEDKNYVISS